MPFPSGGTPIETVPLIFWVLCLSVKHVLADFYWQPTWMAVGKEQAQGWAKPLVLHCAIHGGLTTLLILAFRPEFWLLGFADFCVHLVIDKVKGAVIRRREITQEDRSFWMLLGIDQTLHHLTGFALALILATR